MGGCWAANPIKQTNGTAPAKALAKFSRIVALNIEIRFEGVLPIGGGKPTEPVLRRYLRKWKLCFEAAMRSTQLLCLPLLISTLLCGQKLYGQKPQSWGIIPDESESATRAFPPQLRSELVSLRDAALTDDFAYKQLEYLTDSIGPRPQGSPQADAAARYVAGEMRKLGLDVHLEPVPVRRFMRGTDTAEVVENPAQPEGTRQKIVVTALYGNSPPTMPASPRMSPWSTTSMN